MTSIVFTGCTEEIQIRPPLLSEDAIDFSEGVLTRGTPIESADGILSMGVFCGANTGNFTTTSSSANYMTNLKVSRSDKSTPFSYSPLIYWPAVETNKKLSFFAYSPHNTTLTAGGTLTFSTVNGGPPMLTYTVSGNVTVQPDLLVGVPLKDKTKQNQSTSIAFNMKHALASIGFNIKGQGEKVKAIKVKGVSVQATLACNGETINWINHSAPSNIVFTAGTTTDATANEALTNVMNGDGYLMMIPQTLGVGAKTFVTIEGESADREVSLNGKSWVAGGKYMYDLTLVPGEIIIGRFGGWNGKEYTKMLQVENVKTADDPTLVWATANEVTSATDAHYGISNIATLKALSADLSAYPAAKYCEAKGEGWYLPSHKQLMAIWIAHNGIPAVFSLSSSFSSYWSATENNISSSKGISFYIGEMGDESKALDDNRARCVRDLPDSK